MTRYNDGRMASPAELAGLQKEAWRISEEMAACIEGLSRQAVRRERRSP
ncbi:MAG: hypothetical protein J6P53_07410 [Mailhella sp.]|nr:hypothetical protein [Mailhella sp.]